ncbi:tRNA pseudouridine(38-40) synthase TruA [Cytophagaceae bacterium DM2B3-1]|uniref:tRNA pseudouridine synthase A n=1 Tax=Xanthocytophaga flava TaxID=3048013 RepID=A0AAE3U499_9BACT|nr:tRNA pseudouridine(38-40) synthase TruA [Xanthocytophaga flavus]MDJ1479011.1 tRNA pseudouridine(38-40) synthase TruA [Xanthocytophaga flavus]MDJ1497861.1 tRNA pseudouridine(38-40) synthase TruA [Xanthocytophaga flavus]
MKRYFLEVAYNGTNYHGWQVQANANTVQAELNKALSILLKEPVETLGSGRTDAGVHATQQLVHIDSKADLLKGSIVHSLNALLPADISVIDIYQVEPTAHARFDAFSRSYEYRISHQKNPFLPKMCYRYRGTPDIAQMNEAAQLLLHYTDFECFSKVKTDVNNFRCTITKAFWIYENDCLVFHISANRFLRGMVRAIVGTLLEVGEGKMNIDDFEKVIQGQDRQKAGRAVPPEGLFLTRVEYPFELKKNRI